MYWCCAADGSVEAIAGGAVAGRKAVDFENLAFAQGNHLMTNKKCDLPQKSYRAAHKVRLPYHTPCHRHLSLCPNTCWLKPKLLKLGRQGKRGLSELCACGCSAESEHYVVHAPMNCTRLSGACRSLMVPVWRRMLLVNLSCSHAFVGPMAMKRCMCLLLDPKRL